MKSSICAICLKRFRDTDTLVKHLKRVHGYTR